MDQERRGLTGWCAATVLVSAFLLFQVQPMVSKMILPWFGGSPAVWTSCMLFFQLFLLLGYLYAHLLDLLPRTRWQGIIHLTLLAAAAIALPIVPEPSWKPVDSSHPQGRILLLLAANVGLPYLLLASSAPLIQTWYSRATGGRAPYRLYALSNVGSLAALLSYPFWFEPRFDIPSQGALWSSGFMAYAILCGAFAMAMLRWNVPAVPATISTDNNSKAGPPTAGRILVWLALPAFGSMGLLAVTNQICQDVAVVPFLWIAPLSLYLITFILCFDSHIWYRRNVFAIATLLVVLAISAIVFRDNVQPLLDKCYDWFKLADDQRFQIPDFLDSITLEATLFLLALFFICMICHGELVRSKPAPRYLTLFYLCISAGGALGGLFVALICPKIFSDYIESPIFVVGGGLLAFYIVFDSWWEREQRWSLWWRSLVGLLLFIPRDLTRSILRRDLEGSPSATKRIAKLARAVRRGRPWYTFWNLLVPLPFIAGLVYVFLAVEIPDEEDLVSRRSFYGVLHVTEYDVGEEDARRNLYNGRILHGIQLIAPDRRREPTTYYSYDSGVGLAISVLGEELSSIRVATVGLGTGTIAAYSQAGDYYCFYEINPDVIEIANEYFTFLSDSPAEIHIEEGDARLSMERQSPQRYDVIALDAFSGDAIPAHLLTVEAVATYLRHLKPTGVLAVHTSNRHLDLVPIVALLAKHYELQSVAIESEDYGGVADSSSEWLLLTRDEQFLRRPEIEDVGYPLEVPGPEIRVWTDQYSNLFQILRAWHEEDFEEGDDESGQYEDEYDDESYDEYGDFWSDPDENSSGG